jgi:polyferredoxin
MEIKSKISQVSQKLKLRDHSTTILRRIVQITAFFLINYVILEFIFTINLLAIEGLIKVLPVLNTPRNPLSRGGGILEYIFFSIAEGTFPILLIAILILILLFTNRLFCGWICPIGTIQDGCAAIPVKNKRVVKKETHEKMIKIKYVPVIILIILLVPLGISKLVDINFYLDFQASLGSLAQEPLGYFSLSEYIFVFFPEVITEIWVSATLMPLFSNLFRLIIFVFYIVIIIGSIWYPRVYCRYICPFGAVASAISPYSFLKLSRSPVKCVGRAECGICERVCPKQVRILDEPFEFFTGHGECNFCLKCQEECPYKAIDIKFG